VDFAAFKTDSNLEEVGVWRPCGSGRILVASKSSSRYRKVLQRLLGPHETSITLNVLEEAIAEDIYVQAIAEGLLLNWEGFTEEGAECPYSVENAVRLLKEAKPFRDFVEKAANNIENFRKQKEATEVKN
jgi:hypothetical protein